MLRQTAETVFHCEFCFLTGSSVENNKVEVQYHVRGFPRKLPNHFVRYMHPYPPKNTLISSHCCGQWIIVLSKNPWRCLRVLLVRLRSAPLPIEQS